MLLRQPRHLPTRKDSTKKAVKASRYYTMTKPKARQTIIIYHTLDHNEAKKRIQEYIHKYPGARTSKIIDSLRINPEQVVDILNELENNELIYSRDIGQGPK